MIYSWSVFLYFPTLSLEKPSFKENRLPLAYCFWVLFARFLRQRVSTTISTLYLVSCLSELERMKLISLCIAWALQEVFSQGILAICVNRVVSRLRSLFPFDRIGSVSQLRAA